MEAAGADACLITSNANLFYAVGQVVMGYLYISRQHEPLLFVRRPVGLSGERVIYVRKPEEIAEILTKRGLPHPATLMLEGDSITHSEWLRYENIFPDSKPINGTMAIRKARSVKTAREIELFRQSGKIHAEVYRHIPQLYR